MRIEISEKSFSKKCLERYGSKIEIIPPEVLDVSTAEGVKLEVETTGSGKTELEIELTPLKIARPEFFPSTAAKVVFQGKGTHWLEIPFSQFSFRQMVRAFLKYLDGVTIRLNSENPVAVNKVAFGKMGDFHVECAASSQAGWSGNWISYSVQLENESDRPRMVSVDQSFYGTETLQTRFPKTVSLNAWETKEITVQVYLSEDLPRGGMEKNRFLFVPDGEGCKAQTLTLTTSCYRTHPYLVLTEEQWKKRKAKIAETPALYQAFCETFEKTAKQWIVPEVSMDIEYVYPAYSQNPMFETAVAWKITGKEEYKDKVMRYLRGILDREHGYLATQRSYFIFIESTQEYHRGDFKVRRAQNTGWVQEAEFFSRVAMAYDLFFEFFTEEERRQMEACMRNYMSFAGWRLTDGDGNNYQVAETATGLLCAMVLQDYDKIDRFLHGYNGYYDLLSSVFLDDGMYFEEATGYTRLAGELYFDVVNAAENFGIQLKDLKVPASFDRHIIHSPWSMREYWAEDKKPFLGMSFKRFETFYHPDRCLKDYFDCVASVLTDAGVMFSVNDGNEAFFGELYKKAYYLYGEPKYRKIAELSPYPELIFVREDEKEANEWQNHKSLLLPGAGFGILRDRDSQAVLKFGVHGGYHGHFDRLSFSSFIRNNQTFGNTEYAWYGYASFLFKMWVQTSIAHNMVVVDGRMQEPTPCECIYYKDDKLFSAVCTETVCRWSDVPYGGQTPYPQQFPQEKCEIEGKYVIYPEIPRAQGEIGEYSDPVFQKRLIILFHGYCVILDYLHADMQHVYDCFFHPHGKYSVDGAVTDVHFERYEERYSFDPFNAGQFIFHCHWGQNEGTKKLCFQDAQPRVYENEILDYAQQSSLWRLYPQSGEIMIGKYPERDDTFRSEDMIKSKNYLTLGLKKSVCFRQKGKTACFATLVEMGENEKSVQHIEVLDFQNFRIHERDGENWSFSITGMENCSDKHIDIQISKEA